jgi:hypothetical protein
MEVLISPTDVFDLNQPTSKLIDNKLCVYDYSDKDYQDFFFKKISTFISYRYPSVRLLIDKTYSIEIPLNWRILATNTHDYQCHLVPVEDLLHFDNQIPVFNPFFPGVPKILDVEIQSINPNPVEHFVGKLPKKNLLVMPIGNKSNSRTKIYSKQTNEEVVYPECIFASDDIDMSKCEFDLWSMVG